MGQRRARAESQLARSERWPDVEIGGDGKIYISRVDDAVRIDNGLRGDTAV
ncbi:MAG: hypothetical protein V1929_01025 [bacterium]